MMRSEFQINIKASSKSMQKNLKSIRKEPVIRQFLVLAYQIKDYLEKNPKKSGRTVSAWLGDSPSRVSQLLKLLCLSPQIQEEILLSENPKIWQIPEHKIRVVTRETDWERQWDMWGGLF